MSDLPSAPTFFHEPKLDIYYRPEMALANDPAGNYSRSPSKPRRFMEHLPKTTLQPFLEVRAGYAPLSKADFRLAHTAEYVEAFFAGRGSLARSNSLTWTPEFADMVRYTNGSLVAAVSAVIAKPARIALCPASGFHHARPSGGAGFCTFSGQVIAGVRAWREHGARGAWIDLDGHDGNSIEDSRGFVPDLAEAIPEGCNLNPLGSGRAYLANLERGLQAIGKRVVAGEIDYVAFAHGADSHADDDLGHQCDTYEWLSASRMVYGAVRSWSGALGRPVPLVLAFFGGYREDSLESVLELHAADCAIAIATLAGVDLWHTPRVVRKDRTSWMDFLATIPKDVLERVRGRRVGEAGRVDGDSFGVEGTQRFAPPVPLEEGLVFLETCLDDVRGGALRFDDGTMMRFDPHGVFEKHDTRSEDPPHAGVTATASA